MVIAVTRTQEQRYWGSADGLRFEVLAIYNPNEEQDPWVKYRNTDTLQEYTCRLAAFQARFSPLPD